MYKWIFTTDSSTAVSLTAATALNVARVKAGTVVPVPMFHIDSVALGFNGASATDGPVLVEFLRATVDGTFTAVTAKKRNSLQPGTITDYILCGKNASAAPSGTVDILFQTTIHPQTSRLFDASLWNAREFNTTEVFSVRLTAPQNQSVYFTIEGGIG